MDDFFRRVLLRLIPYLGRRLSFSFYWLFNLWGNKETRSGDGSTLAYTAELRKALPEIMHELSVRVFFDAPCGDFHWMRYVDFSQRIEYIGGDIVKPMIKRLQRLYGNEYRKFIVIDVVRDPLPRADLWMCRDLIFHLPNQDIYSILRNFIQSDIEWLLITSHAARSGVNRDIRPGQFRLVNLLEPPFSLPPARRKLKDYVKGYPERYLLLYHRSDLINNFGFPNKS